MAVTLGSKSGALADWTTRPQRGERREWPRYTLDVGAEIELAADGQKFPCQMEDISLGGARLNAEGLPPFARLTVSLYHPASGRCTVTRSWRHGDQLGVTFDFSPECLALIAHFVRQQVTTAEPARAAAG
ncbi:MAG: PilZ domain-containing protein [Kiloniellales bacterium]